MHIIGFLLFTLVLNANLLQNAIDNAKDGDILNLSSGTYNGNIIIDKAISIIGKSDDVIIRGDGNGTVVKILSSFVTLKNLHIQNSGNRHDLLDSAIIASKVKQIEISNIKITQCLFGIDMQIVSNSIIKNNYIESFDTELGLRGDGLRVWYSNDNIISGNELYKSRDMVVWYSHGNVIENNKGSFGRYSLHFMHAGMNIIKNNIYKMNSVGIFFMFSRDSIVSNNTIESSIGSTGMGIGLKEVDHFTISNNNIAHNAIGIYVDRSPYEFNSTNTFRENMILYNTEAIKFNSININNSFVKNTFLGNIEDIVASTPKSNIYKNKFYENYWDNYQGFDRDKDDYGDTSHKKYGYMDQLWAHNENLKYFYGSPIISLLEFLFKLAPFTEPVFLFEDPKPKISQNKKEVLNG